MINVGNEEHFTSPLILQFIILVISEYWDFLTDKIIWIFLEHIVTDTVESLYGIP